MNSSLTTIEILPENSLQYSVIWMHGLGADGHDFEAVVPLLQLKEKKIHSFRFS